MSAARPLTPDGKPMRALRALASRSDDHANCRQCAPSPWLHEWEVGYRARAATGSGEWYAPLARLVALGYAARADHGFARWQITDAGRALLAEVEQGSRS